MAIFKGREQLEESYDIAKRSEDRKGIEGELKVGNLLKQYLPNDTYIISQPIIGNYQPDFLIISPKFGFRIIEVKNYSLKGIKNVLSNGALVTKYGKSNPLEQIKRHVDDLKNYLISNHSYLGDAYKMIGFIVVYADYTQNEFIDKFINTLGTWEKEHQTNYFQHNLFIDQIDKNSEFLLINATRFKNVNLTPLTESRIKDIVSFVKVGNYKKDLDEYLEKMDKEHKEKFNSLHKEINELKAGIEEKNSPKRSMKPVVFLSIGVLVLIAGIFFYNNIQPTENASVKPESDIVYDLTLLVDSTGKDVKVEASVEKFFFDNESGTKFLTISDGENTMEAVIFKDQKTPYIEEGKSYTFEGTVETYKGEIELVVSSIVE